MARSDILTSHLLNRWPAIMGESVFRYNQILGANVEVQACPVYIQPDRDELARAINKALNMSARELGFWPVPEFHTQEQIDFGAGYPYWRQPLRLRYGYLRGLGTRATSLIQAGATVTYSDSDGDGTDDTATISVTTSVDESEVAIFFRTADGAYAAADPRWEIDNLRKSTSGGVVTLTGHRGLFVKPSVWAQPYEAPNYNVVNAADNIAGNYVTTVDVYRVYVDSTVPVTLVYYDDCTQVDTNVTTTARIIDSELGFISINRPANCVGYPYHKVLIDYYAGYPLRYGNPEPVLEEMVIRLANTYVPKEQCSWCDRVSNHWSNDTENFDLTRSNVDWSRMFGMQKGQVNAAQVVAEWRLGQGGKVTV